MFELTQSESSPKVGLYAHFRPGSGHASDYKFPAGPDRNGKQSFAAVVPSTRFGQKGRAPRRIVMPIAQARKAIKACLAALTVEDTFGLMVFAESVEAMPPTLVPCARSFLKRADARGGTKLAEGVRQAAQVLGGTGDILIITDGQVFGTENIRAEARATGIRLSCLGIGSASQDRFLTLLARETGGVSRLVTPRERVDLSAVELFASIGHPVAAGLKADGNVRPDPVLLFGEGE